MKNYNKELKTNYFFSEDCDGGYGSDLYESLEECIDDADNYVTKERFRGLDCTAIIYAVNVDEDNDEISECEYIDSI